MTTTTTKEAYRVSTYFRRNREIKAVVPETIDAEEKMYETPETIREVAYWLIGEEVMICDWDTLEDAMEWEYEMLYC